MPYNAVGKPVGEYEIIFTHVQNILTNVPNRIGKTEDAVQMSINEQVSTVVVSNRRLMVTASLIQVNAA